MSKVFSVTTYDERIERFEEIFSTECMGNTFVVAKNMDDELWISLFLLSNNHYEVLRDFPISLKKSTNSQSRDIIMSVKEEMIEIIIKKKKIEGAL